jgi:signal transduction histidine kinase
VREEEKTREQLVREVETLRRQLAQLKAAEALKQRLETQLSQEQMTSDWGTLTHDIINEFNNVMTVMLGYTELVLCDIPKDSVMWRRLQYAHTAGKRANDLIRQLSIANRQAKQKRKFA